MSISQESAETVGLQCLSWLVSQEDMLPVFLGSSGASAQDLKEQAGNPEFLGSVLDFLLMDDEWVVEFCAAFDLANEMPMRARMALPGGSEVNWT